MCDNGYYDVRVEKLISVENISDRMLSSWLPGPNFISIWNFLPEFKKII